MPKSLHTLGLLCLLSYSAFAQTPDASPPAPAPSLLTTVPDSIPTMLGKWYLPHYEPSPTVADTTGALVSLFARKRNSAFWYLLPLPIGAAMVSPIKQDDGSSRAPDAWQVPVGVPIMLLSAGGYIARLATYSRDRLKQIERDYLAGKPIPANLHRKLKPVYFANAAVMRVALMQQVQMRKLREEQRAARRK